MEEKKDKQKMQVSVNLDNTPVLYTDNIQMTVNADGVTLDVMQRLGSTNQMRVVSRIGMSKEHAKKFVEKLGKLLLKTEGVTGTSDKILS